MRPVLLDLFCGAGGAAMGYRRAGFDVVGVDIEPQPHYPFEFVQDDAMAVLGFLADDIGLGWAEPGAIHASPPCQAYTPMTNRRPSHQPMLIEPVRAMLRASGLPYVIENVVGAPLRTPARLCGMAFGLPLHRHRLFETTIALMSTPCGVGFDESVAVYGPPDGRRIWTRKDGSELRAWSSLKEGQDALGVPWIDDWHGVREAIPPAFTEFIGAQLIDRVKVRA